MSEINFYLTYKYLNHDKAELIAILLRETAEEVTVDIEIGVDFQGSTEVCARYSSIEKTKKAKEAVSDKFKDIKNVW